MKIKTVILDGDRNYIDRILQYFQVHYADKMELSVFSDPASLYGELQEQKPDILLADSRMPVDRTKLQDSHVPVFARLCESPDIEEIEGDPAICKYQKADTLFKQILGLYADQSGQMKFREGSSAEQVFLFCSAQGGSGTTAAAAAYALYLAGKEGKQVCYLDLQPFGDSEQYFSGDGSASLSDVIYALKSRKSNLAMKLESAMKTDRSGVDYFAPCRTACDFMELKDDEIRRLLQAISQMKEYDALVLDISGDLDDRKLRLMQEHADRIIAVNDGSETGNSKFRKFYEVLRIQEERTGKDFLSGMGILYNRFSSRTGRQLEQSPVTILGGIHRYEGISGRDLIEAMQENPALGQI